MTDIVHPTPTCSFKERIETVRGVIVEGYRTLECAPPCDLSGDEWRTPKGVLEALTTAKPRIGSASSNPNVGVANTRRLLGLQEAFKIVNASNCVHEGSRVRDTLTARYCWPAVLEVDFKRSTAGDVEGALKELVDVDASAGTERQCVFCTDEGKDPVPLTLTQREWSGFRRDMFFVSLGNDGLAGLADARAKHSHWVEMFGTTFTLCGVVYRTRKGKKNHYTSQILLEGRWWEYNDMQRNGSLKELGDFNVEVSGAEDTLMYVRAGVVERAFPAEESIGGSPTSCTDASDDEVGINKTMEYPTMVGDDLA